MYLALLLILLLHDDILSSLFAVVDILLFLFVLCFVVLCCVVLCCVVLCCVVCCFVKLLAAVLLQNAGATMERLVLREGALPTEAVDHITQVRYATCRLVNLMICWVMVNSHCYLNSIEYLSGVYALLFIPLYYIVM